MLCFCISYIFASVLFLSVLRPSFYHVNSLRTVEINFINSCNRCNCMKHILNPKIITAKCSKQFPSSSSNSVLNMVVNSRITINADTIRSISKRKYTFPSVYDESGYSYGHSINRNVYFHLKNERDSSTPLKGSANKLNDINAAISDQAYNVVAMLAELLSGLGIIFALILLLTSRRYNYKVSRRESSCKWNAEEFTCHFSIAKDSK